MRFLFGDDGVGEDAWVKSAYWRRKNFEEVSCTIVVLQV